MLQRDWTLNTARPRVEHLREFLGGWPVGTITADAVRQYQLFRRKQGAEAATLRPITAESRGACPSRRSIRSTPPERTKNGWLVVPARASIDS